MDVTRGGSPRIHRMRTPAEVDPTDLHIFNPVPNAIIPKSASKMTIPPLFSGETMKQKTTTMNDLDLLYGKCRRNDRGEPCLCLKAEEGRGIVAVCADWIPVSTIVRATDFEPC